MRRSAVLLLTCLLLSPAVVAAEEAMPTPAAPPTEEVPAATATPAETPAAAPAPSHEAHLASYRRMADAERGWKVLTDAYSSVLYFHPAIREVDLPGKNMGHFFRLFAAGDQEMMTSLCKSMHEKKLYCVIMPAGKP
jgi:hypothetical protein